ncbi:hypothetical protein H5410_043890 [Solanum commersonii]|uniref:Uncharacterized protein n=1 Tax=Solanum commersonii TaxID=4109 RepID=A0A9J5Y1H9_SOLCO|nr:hypothetical protein H5410_043890 [Solanum commersonii]
MVKWEVVMNNKKEGGMGSKNLKVQNQSLLLKWLWRFASVKQGLWKDVIISSYAMEDSWTRKEVRSPYGVGLWRTIRNLWPKIWRNSKIDIGNGRKTFFWNDVWVGQHSLKQLHPEIYNLNQQKEATVAEVKDNQGWNLSFRRRLNDWEIDKLADFYKSLEQVFLNLRGISWSMQRHTSDFLACWNREGIHQVTRRDERLSLLASGGQFGRKGTRDASKTRASLSRV